MVVATKTDLIKFDNLEPEKKQLIQGIVTEGVDLVTLSNITDDGVAEVKQKACDKLLAHRVETKMAKGGKKVESILQRIHLAQPVKRDDKPRPPSIPESVLAKKNQDGDMMEIEKKKTEKDLEEEHGGAGVYQPDLRKNYILKNEEWKYDIIPEILEGKNISDYIDPDILKKLDELEKEEEIRLQNDEGKIDWTSEEFYIPPEEQEKYDTVKAKQRLYQLKKQINKSTNHVTLPRKHKAVSILTVFTLTNLDSIK